MTSFFAVAKLRRILGIKRIGHAGTLDPMATGVLCVCFGGATKLVPYLMEGPKQYRFSIRMGIITDTLDITGQVLEQNEPCFDEEKIKEVAKEFVGEILQVPPMYSALKKDGKKLYELAREGIEVEREARPVTIYSLDYEGREENGDHTFLVHCSKGTYVRTLCQDMGEKLGCGACVTRLHRVEGSGFLSQNSHTLEEIEQGALAGNLDEFIYEAEQMVAKYPSLVVDEIQEGLIKNGVQLTLSRTKWQGEEKTIGVFSKSGKLLMMAKPNHEQDVLEMITSFYGSLGV